MPQRTRNKASQYELKHYAMFAGKTIVKVELAEFEEGFGLVPTFTFQDGSYAQIWADPEGNGPGWVSLHDADGHELVPNGLKTGDFNTPK